MWVQHQTMTCILWLSIYQMSCFKSTLADSIHGSMRTSSMKSLGTLSPRPPACTSMRGRLASDVTPSEPARLAGSKLPTQIGRKVTHEHRLQGCSAVRGQWSTGACGESMQACPRCMRMQCWHVRLCYAPANAANESRCWWRGRPCLGSTLSAAVQATASGSAAEAPLSTPPPNAAPAPPPATPW